MLQAFSTPHNTRISVAFVTATLVFVAAAAALGIDDSLPGSALGMLAVITALIAFVHPWRTETPFRYLLWGSLAAVVPCGIAASFFDSIQGTLSPGSVSQVIVHILNVVFFVLAMFVFPPAMLVGLAGSLATARRVRRNKGAKPKLEG